MPLCVNRTFFTAWFLTSATAGGVNPSAAAVARQSVRSAFVSAHKNASVRHRGLSGGEVERKIHETSFRSARSSFC